jgi:2-polyprenyl-3-methyl-5-hydroxy-6-metoxy-1,4-benzoquinol methylase
MFVNSPLKKIMLRYFELPIFKKYAKSIGVNLNKMVILDGGCGSGYGLKRIYKSFRPKALYGIDILPREVQLAQHQKIPAKVFTRNLVDTKFPSKKFDAVFIFTVLHHIPEWRQALKEISRILKPNGILFVDELNRKLVEFFRITTGVQHPPEAQFEWSEFIEGLKEANFIIARKRIIVDGFGLFCCVKNSK